MNRIPKPSKSNPFAGFINSCRDYDSKQSVIKVTKITMWDWFKISASSWWSNI